MDCVRFGLLSGLVAPVDLVVSGINHGLTSATTSPTPPPRRDPRGGDPLCARDRRVAAGRRPQLPVQRSGPHVFFRARCKGSEAGARRSRPGRRRRAPSRNVNLPSGQAAPLVVLTRPGRRHFAADVVKSLGPFGEQISRSHPTGCRPIPRRATTTTRAPDFAALRSGCISVSLLAAGAADEASGEAGVVVPPGTFDAPDSAADPTAQLPKQRARRGRRRRHRGDLGCLSPGGRGVDGRPPA